MAVGEGCSAADQLINTACALGSTTIDLNRKHLTEIPKELLDLKQLEFLYLEGNCISSIPEELFRKLSCLRWLDLRNNRLSEIPSVAGEHRNLRNLLLEGNNIKMLPLELGLIKSLSGLNLTGNPLEFPPPQVTERGTQEVLKFLRERYLEQENGEAHLRERLDSTSSEELSEEAPPDYVKRKTRAGKKARRHSNSQSATLNGPVNTPVAFHPPPSRSDRIRLEYDKQRMALQSSGGLSVDVRTREWPGSTSSSSKKKASSKSASASSSTALRFQYDSTAPTFPDYETKMAEHHEMAVNAALNEKEALIFQRRMNKQALDSWRDHTKRLRQQKQRFAASNGPLAVDVKAPYGTEQSAEEEKQSKQPSGYAKALKELLDGKDREAPRRALMDRELETRIKMHMGKLQEHRKKTYSNIQEELESARKNLEIAHQFQRDLGNRRELEYRLRAFTGDDVASATRTKHSPTKGRKYKT